MSPATNTSELLKLEYEINVDLWKHDDWVRERRIANYLTVNTILLIALSAVISLGLTYNYISLISILFSSFGILFCVIWKRLLMRNSQYILFRRLQLLSIESRMPGITTFTNTYDALYRFKEITFKGIDEKFKIDKRCKKRSGVSEELLPVYLALFWGIVLLISTLISILSFLS